MNPMQKVSIYYDQLTKAEKATCHLIIENPEVVINNPIARASEIYKVSPSSILRLTKKLDYKGYSEFRYALESYKNQNKSEEKQNTFLYNKIINVYQSNFEELNKTLNENDLHKLIHIIKTKNIKTIGIGSSAFPAEQLAHSLCNEGKWADAVIDNVKITFIDKNVNKNDAIIIFSVSGHVKLFYDEAKKWKKSGATLIVITSNPDSKLNTISDLTILLPTLPLTMLQSSNHARYLENRSFFYIFIDILLAYYINENND